MSLLTVNFRGQSIGQYLGMTVILPDTPGPFPVLYLLHGFSDDHTGWTRRTSIERYVESHHLAVAMPTCLQGWYANDPRFMGLKYEDYIVKDVVGYMDATFRTIPDRSARAVAGLSMGGYGAVLLGMRHSDAFSVACSHSGALAFLQSDDPDWLMPYRNIYESAKYNLFELAPQHARSGQKVALRFDCGRQDFLIQHNRDFHALLNQLQVPHEYEEFDGDHNWGYWDLHVQETIAFAMRHLAVGQ